MRQTEPIGLAAELNTRWESLSKTRRDLSAWWAELRAFLRAPAWGDLSDDRLAGLTDRGGDLVFQGVLGFLSVKALRRHPTWEKATAWEARDYGRLRRHFRLILEQSSLLASMLSIAHLASMHALTDKVIRLQITLEKLRGAKGGQRLRQRLEFLRDLEVSQTILREPPIYEHWRREGGDLDIAALFEGVNEPELLGDLERRLTEHERQAGRLSEPSLLSHLMSPVGWGGDALRRSYRRSLRSAYADEAPVEGLRRAGGVLLSRHRAYDPETGEETDGLDLLPAGGSSPEGLDPEEILLQKEERAAAHGEVRPAEADFRAEVEALGVSGRQQDVLLDYFIRARSQGYGPASKKGVSMRQYWGAGYGAKQRMRQRLEEAHPAFFGRWSRLLLGADRSGPE